jgi:Kef-type K+ transport system membrane component KefB
MTMSSISARIAGEPWRESLAVGSLMNARALMELIVIKVGLDMGVIGAELFTMLLIMAILTTAMTGPMLTAVMRGAADLACEAPVRCESHISGRSGEKANRLTS